MSVAEERSIEELVDAVMYGELSLQGWDEEFEQLRARINLVCVASPDLGFPPLNEGGMRDFLTRVIEAVEDVAAVNVTTELRALWERSSFSGLLRSRPPHGAWVRR